MSITLVCSGRNIRSPLSWCIRISGKKDAVKGLEGDTIGAEGAKKGMCRREVKVVLSFILCILLDINPPRDGIVTASSEAFEFIGVNKELSDVR